MRNRSLGVIALALLLAAFDFGLMRLFELRYSAGDVYPPYSSLRADPLGAKVLHDALREVPGLSVSRNMQPLFRLARPAGSTVLLLGLEGPADLQALAVQGARVVISNTPVAETAGPGNGTAKGGAQTRPVQGGRPQSKSTRPRSLSEAWGFDFDDAALPRNEAGEARADAAQRVLPSDLPASISWHSTRGFTYLKPEWRVVYARGPLPVLIERPVGRGSVVLCADSYFLSNEAMRAEPHATLLAWLLGGNRRIVFDETHLGVEERPGIAALARRYRLHGFVGGLLLLAALAVWRAASGFLPPLPEAAPGAGTVAGRDATAGLANLLRRGIPPSRVLAACAEEWKRSFAHARPEVAAALDTIPLDPQDPARGYQRISHLIQQMKGHHES